MVPEHVSTFRNNNSHCISEGQGRNSSGQVKGCHTRECRGCIGKGSLRDYLSFYRIWNDGRRNRRRGRGSGVRGRDGWDLPRRSTCLNFLYRGECRNGQFC